MKAKIEKLRKDFNVFHIFYFKEHKEKSYKVLVSNEENYKKILTENNEIKAEIVKLRSEMSAKELQEQTEKMENNSNSSFIKPNSFSSSLSLKKYNNLNPNFNLTEIDGQKVSIEYLKNILLKYLEAMSIGNEFQCKILENVLFTMLNVNESEKANLEERRQRSSFYYNLWYNAKAFLSAKIYRTNSNEGIIRQNSNHSLNLTSGNLDKLNCKAFDDMNIDINIEGKNSRNNNNNKEKVVNEI